MQNVTFRFFRPNSLIGNLICWRLGEPWSHVAILIEDAAYSDQMPHVEMLPLTHKDIAMPPRTGKDVIVNMTEDEIATIKSWCDGKVGQYYDFLSVFGWALGWDWLQSRSNSYCFEFCYKALVSIKWLPEDNDDLIKGNKLIEDIESYFEKLNVGQDRIVGIKEYN
jgi:hypothetical protein